MQQLASQFTKNATITAPKPVPKERQNLPATLHGQSAQSLASRQNLPATVHGQSALAVASRRRPLPELPTADDDKPKLKPPVLAKPKTAAKADVRRPPSIGSVYESLPAHEPVAVANLPVTPSSEHVARQNSYIAIEESASGHVPAAECDNSEARRKRDRETIYATYADVPKSVKDMSKYEVADCLRLLHLEKYRDTFIDQDIDGSLLSDLRKDMLTSEFGMTSFEALKLLKFTNHGWKPK